VGLPTGSQLPSGIHVLWCGVPSISYRWVSAPLWTSMDCRGTTCLIMIFITSCKGRLSAPRFCAPPSPPHSLLTLMSAKLFFSHSLSLLSPYTAVSPLSFFLPFLKYVITEVLPPSLIDLALGSSGSVLEPSSTGFIRHGGSFWKLLTEATAIAPLLPKPCHANPQHYCTCLPKQSLHVL